MAIGLYCVWENFFLVNGEIVKECRCFIADLSAANNSAENSIKKKKKHKLKLARDVINLWPGFRKSFESNKGGAAIDVLCLV